MIHKHCNISPPHTNIPKYQWLLFYEESNEFQMVCAKPHMEPCRNPKPSPSPCQVFFWPFKPLSHNSCASRIKRSKQCKADKGAAVCLFMPRPRVRSSNAAIYLQSSQCSCCAFLVRVWFYCCGETTASFPGRPLCIKEDRTSEGRMEGEVVCDRLTPNTTNICSSSRTEAKHIHSWSV